MKNKTLIFHIAFWIGLYLLWVVAFRSYAISLTKTMTIEFCYLIFVTIDYYVISYLAIPKLLFEKRVALFIVTIIAVVALSAWLRSLVATQINLRAFHTAPVDFVTLYGNSLVNISLWVLLIILGKLMIDRVNRQKELELLEKEKNKNELDYLKAQINPHALFNSLNTIYGSIDRSNQSARKILLQFSELLRYQLYDCAADKVSLEKEVEYIRNYVVFQQLRKNENLIVQLDIENSRKELSIAPLLLIVLAENAFKFVSSSLERQNKICIKVSTHETILHMSILNTIESFPPPLNDKPRGIGLINLQRRLELLYPNHHELNNTIRGGYYEANLTLDLA